MRNKMYYKVLGSVLLILFVMAAVFAGGCGTGNTPAPKPLNDDQTGQNEDRTGQMAPDNVAAMPPRMVIGYYENPWPGTPDQSGSFPSMKAHANSMSAVGPFWFKATKEGTLEAKDSQLVYDTVRQLGLKMYPLVTNKTGSTDAVLGDPALRTKVTDNIVKLVQEKGYDGINIDFELLPPKHKDNLTAFMAELYPKMQAINKLVIVSVFPRVEVAEDVSGAYDYPNLAKNADFLQIMTYDNHWATSEPGPIAPVDWYEKKIKYAI